ncbi:SGNH/GDSL hydrolase family protein, partial [uncultured Bacteroides sp.]
MNGKRIGRWGLLAVICLSFSIGEAFAQKKDFANLTRYAKENSALSKTAKKEKRVVFMGNSITEGWVRTHPEFFKTNGYIIGRGISGQTSYQFLLRFREDVINLSPALVVINAGTNDVAENTQPYNEDYTFGNIVSMVELARANKIKVVLTSVLPAAAFKWRMEIKDVPQKIQALNARIETYAKVHKIPFVDYYNAMVADDNRTLNPQYTKDGVHPTGEGYDVMERLIKTAINKA